MDIGCLGLAKPVPGGICCCAPQIRPSSGTGDVMRRHGLGATTLRMSGVAVCLAALVAVSPSGGAVAAPETDTGASYLDPHASVSSRVEDLLRRMTLAEKVGQMDQIVTGALRDNANPADGNCHNSGGGHDPRQTHC